MQGMHMAAHQTRPCGHSSTHTAPPPPPLNAPPPKPAPSALLPPAESKLDARSYSEGPPFEGHRGPGRKVGPLKWDRGVEGDSGGRIREGRRGGTIVSTVSVRPREPPCSNLSFAFAPQARTHARPSQRTHELTRTRYLASIMLWSYCSNKRFRV
jgi:hypothetical protein